MSLDKMVHVKNVQMDIISMLIVNVRKYLILVLILISILEDAKAVIKDML
jgi:hypothetical protein